MAKTTHALPLALFAFLVALSLVSLGSAVVSINTPAASGVVNGTFLFNVTTNITGALQCNWSTTANPNFAITLNTTDSQSIFLNSSVTTALTEVASTTLTVSCQNATTVQSATRTIRVDNTAPTCGFTISDDAITRQSGRGISVDDSSSDTTTLTYLFNLTNSESVQKQTSTSSDPTFSNGDLEDLGEHTITLRVTDLALKSSTCSKTFFVKSSSDSQGTVTITSAQEKQKNNTLFILILIAVAVIVALAVVFLLAIGKTKRR